MGDSNKYNDQQSQTEKFDIERVLNHVQETRGSFASNSLAKITLQYLLATVRDPRQAFGGDTVQAKNLANRIVRQKWSFTIPSVALALGLSHLVDKKFPVRRQGWWKFRRFAKLISIFFLGVTIIEPLMYKLISSRELGEESKNMLLKHAGKINSPDLELVHPKKADQ